MDESALHERSEGEIESTGTDSEDWLEAAAGVWQAWLGAGGALAVAIHFRLTESIWETEAEIFYAEIFAVVAVVALGYAVYEVRSRASRY